MRIDSPAHGMDFEWDPEEKPATFDDPNLPSTAAYGPEFFGALVGYELFEADMVAPWSLQELGYTNDALHFHPDGRVDSQQHPPDYYAYSPHTDTWGDGLEEIENFDWSSDKENEENAGDPGDKGHDEEAVQAAYDAVTQCLVDQDEDINLVDGDAAYLSKKVESPTTQLETSIQNSNKLSPPDTTASALEVPESNKGQTHLTSPASKSSPEPKKTTTQTTEDVGSGSQILDDQHIETQDAMDIDDLAIVAEAERSNTDLQIEDEMAIEEEPSTTSDAPACQKSVIVGDTVAEMESRSDLEDENVAKASVIAFAPISPSQHNLPEHKPNMSMTSQVNTAAQALSNDISIQPEPPLALHAVQEKLHLTSCGRGGKATSSNSDALDRLQPQKDGLDTQDQLHGEFALRTHPVVDTLRLPSEGLPKARDLPTHPTDKLADEVPEVESAFTTLASPGLSIVSGGEPVGSRSPEALSRMQEDVEEPWQAQLRDAAKDEYPGGLLENLPSGYRDRKAQSTKMSQEITAEEASVQASPPLGVPLSEQQPEDSATLPPLPFSSGHDAEFHEKSHSSPAGVTADGKDVCATQLAHTSSKPPASSDLEPKNTALECHTTASEFMDGTVIAAEVEEDLIEDAAGIHAQGTTEDLGSTTSVLGTDVQAAIVETRSKGSENKNNTSSSESEGPPKKKAKTSTFVPASARAGRILNRKLNKAPEEQESETTLLVAKTRRAINSKEEDFQANSVNEESSLSTQNGSTLKFGHFACGKYTGQSAQAPNADGLGDRIIDTQSNRGDDDAVMEEHYSDVEIPVTPGKHASAAEKVPSTPTSRPKVSKRELDGVTTPTKYRERSSKAKQPTEQPTKQPISRKLFSSHKLDPLDTLMSSVPSLKDSISIPVSNPDSFVLVDDAGGAKSAPKVSTRPAPKSRATPAKAMRVKAVPAPPGPTKKTPAARATKKAKITPEEEEYELFPAPKIDTKPPSPEKEVPEPPRPLRATRNKRDFAYVAPWVKDSPSIEYAESDGDKDELSDISEPEGGNEGPQYKNDDPKGEDQDDEDFEDAQETIEVSDESEEADDDTSDTPPPTNKHKSKPKNKPLMLGGHTISNTRSRTSTPARTVASSIATPPKNKFGFTPPHVRLTRQASKAAGGPTAPNPATAKPASKAKAATKSKAKKPRGDTAPVPASEEEDEDESPTAAPKTATKRKGKDSTAPIATATPEPTRQLSKRKTRHASAMEGEEKETERVKEEKDKAKFKRKLRSAG
jgi:hypothetical protein